MSPLTDMDKIKETGIEPDTLEDVVEEHCDKPLRNDLSLLVLSNRVLKRPSK
jgi:hypothetical protein